MSIGGDYDMVYVSMEFVDYTTEGQHQHNSYSTSPGGSDVSLLIQQPPAFQGTPIPDPFTVDSLRAHWQHCTSSNYLLYSSVESILLSYDLHQVQVFLFGFSPQQLATRINGQRHQNRNAITR